MLYDSMGGRGRFQRITLFSKEFKRLPLYTSSSSIEAHRKGLILRIINNETCHPRSRNAGTLSSSNNLHAVCDK